MKVVILINAGHPEFLGPQHESPEECFADVLERWANSLRNGGSIRDLEKMTLRSANGERIAKVTVN